MKKEVHNTNFLRYGFSRMNFFIFPVLILLSLGIGISAQESNETPTPTPTPKLSDVEVKSVRNINPAQGTDAGIGDEIKIEVNNLQTLLDFSKCKDKQAKPIADCTPQKIALFLNGKEIKGLSPTAEPIDDEKTGHGFLQFKLKYQQDVNSETWVDLLGGQSEKVGNSYRRPIYVSVGFENGAPLKVQATEPFNLILMHLDWRFWVCLVLIILIVLYLIGLARNTELLRNSGPLPDSPVKKKKWWLFNREIATVHKPYSPARVQMAFWFSLVIIAFLYIWLATGASDTITSTVLALIGIGAGTALGAVVIDKSKATDNENALNLLRTEEAQLQAEINTLNEKILAADNPAEAESLTDDKGEKSKRLTTVQELITKFSSGTQSTPKPKVSEQFLLDVLTDEDGGISFHRFQMLTWALILGVLFVYQVLNRMSMPEFSATLLGLLGISNGTYLGFKIPENSTNS